MRKPFIGGNWKMNGTKTVLSALLKQIVDKTENCNAVDVAIFPNFVYLDSMKALLSGSMVQLGAQNQSDHNEGAFTGDTSPKMLKDMGCDYVLLGHSERRHLRGESNDFIARKFVLAKQDGLVPVLCVGETDEQRERGRAEKTVRDQLDAVIKCAGVDALYGAVIAYEPVWAIGTGKVATSEEVQAMHVMIRQHLKALDEELASETRIIYGGSLKATNAAEIFAMADVDGGLIGGASLKADDFAQICNLAQIAAS